MAETAAADARVVDRNNGDVVPETIMVEIAEAGGPAEGDAWWVADDDVTGVMMPDVAIDWIDATANEESPTATSHSAFSRNPEARECSGLEQWAQTQLRG